jgi:hypothetical protein
VEFTAPLPEDLESVLESLRNAAVGRRAM